MELAQAVRVGAHLIGTEGCTRYRGCPQLLRTLNLKVNLATTYLRNLFITLSVINLSASDSIH